MKAEILNKRKARVSKQFRNNQSDRLKKKQQTKLKFLSEYMHALPFCNTNEEAFEKVNTEKLFQSFEDFQGQFNQIVKY